MEYNMKMIKLSLLIILTSGCIQFEETVEEIPSNQIVRNRKNFRFQTQASTLDTREYAYIDLNKIKDENPGIQRISIFSNSNSAYISFSRSEMEGVDRVKIRKFNEKYFASIDFGERMKTIELKF